MPDFHTNIQRKRQLSCSRKAPYIMYQGTNKTALASQTQIAEALLSLMEHIPYAQISICQICREAEVSRQTFYSLFSSKDKVITYELEKHYGFDLSGCCCSIQRLTLQDISRIYSRYITESGTFLRMLVENDLIDCMTQSLRDSFTACEVFLPDCSAEQRTYAGYYLAGALTSIVQCYVLSGETTSRQQLEEIICTLLGGRLFDL